MELQSYLYRNTLILAICITSAFLILSAVSYNNAANELAEAHKIRYDSYLLADEMRQSSDDLTRLGRTYVVTSDKSYKNQYNEILDIRNGKKARPKEYNRIYWDFVAGGISNPRQTGRTISLLNLMKDLGFTDEEFVQLENAQKSSDGLVQLEVKAMSIADKLGSSDDATGERVMATASLHSPDYHKYKATIMKSVDAFYGLLDKRTTGSVNSHTADKLNWGLSVLLSATLLFVSLFMMYIYKMKQRNNIVQVFLGKMENLSTKFHESSKNLASSSHAFTDATQKNSNTVNIVRSDATSASENVSTVSAAAEELSASIVEIERFVHESSTISKNASDEANEITVEINKLSETANKIGSVMGIIQNIADQTNLLALNASIEAARAGEAGRGFAVVADEVKNLSAQTSSETNEISQIVSEIQQSTTNAVTSIQSMAKTIGTSGDIIKVISESISQQGIATADIARSIHAVATGSENVSINIGEIESDSEVIKTSSVTLNELSVDLVERSNELKSEVEEFVKQL